MIPNQTTNDGKTNYFLYAIIGDVNGNSNLFFQKEMKGNWSLIRNGNYFDFQPPNVITWNNTFVIRCFIYIQKQSIQEMFNSKELNSKILEIEMKKNFISSFETSFFHE
jgi:hypothetical protein